MPLIKSAIKRARQNDVRRTRLQPSRTYMKTMMRTIATLKKDQKTEEMIRILPAVYKAIDTAAKKGIIHKKNAARKKSLVARMVAAK